MSPNHKRPPHAPAGKSAVEAQQTTDAGEGVQTSKALRTVGGNISGRASVKNRMAVCHKIKNRMTRNPLLVTHPKVLQAGSQREMRTPVSVAVLFTITKRWK